MKIGFHFPFSGSLNKLKERVAISRGNTFQIFSRGLRGGSLHPINKRQKKEYDQFIATKHISPVIIHAPYIYNLTQSECSDREMILEDLAYAQELSAQYYIIHAGSAKKVHPILALEHVKRHLVDILNHTEFKGTLLIKNMSGAGSEVAYDLDDWNELISFHPQIKGVLDIARAYSAGYDTRELYEIIEDQVGWDKIEVVVLLDNDRPPGSNKNIFAPLGEGMIGYDGLTSLLKNERVKQKTWIVENQPSLSHTDATLRFLMSFFEKKDGENNE